MGIKTVKTIGKAPGKVNPIPTPPPTGVKEDGFKKQFDFDNKQRPASKYVNKPASAETGNPNGQGYGTKVQ